jgi:hypothetical protein
MRLYLRARLCDWHELNDRQQAASRRVKSGKLVSVPFIFLSQSDDPAAQLACAVSVRT